ncbi:hypothetical protein HYC85_021843 [Camellia sinensis]|uniref:Beta-galactosidase n=1 Tax=Camellia sinensis TaxID=4442 RepID=A0A7J7GMK6_CAMSI|nr:hypothetical protein HYC85_021843 [Camellia sinensis]
MWPSLIKKAKEGGLNAIETYVFWNAHEPIYRQYDFSENLDLVRFIRAIHEEGLYAILRIGPYVCAEWNYGGFPVWLHNIPGIAFRTNNEVYENEMKNFTTLIVDMVRDEGLFASKGGPIILAQIENEYGNVMWSYGNEGKSYINWCADLAQSFTLECHGLCANNRILHKECFKLTHAMVGIVMDSILVVAFRRCGPKIGAAGSIRVGAKKLRTELLKILPLRLHDFFNMVARYKTIIWFYHGGTNFGRVSGGPYIATTYDYDAPLDEYGNLNQPKWGHLKQLHLLIRSMEDILTHAVIRNVEYGNMMTATIFKYSGKRVCFFGNANDKDDITINFENNNYTIPAWSVSILPDCYTEVYNTARVNTQTSNMVMKLNEADEYQEPYNLQWTWKSEHFEHLKFNDKKMTNDYIYTGSQWAKGGHYEFDFESMIKMKNGTNSISLLSVTVGLENYGGHFDEIKNGIHGPVKLMGDNNQVKDLQNSTWTYKVGIHGIDKKKLYMRENRYNRKWELENLPTDRMFVWYQTTFMAPMGDDPVVLDLLGLGKGIAWVPCATFGGNPANLKIQTVTVGTICANAYEGNKLELSCQGGTISEIKFASYGMRWQRELCD